MRNLHRSPVVWVVLLGGVPQFTGSVFAKDGPPCDCMAVKLVPSKDRIKIRYPKEERQLLDMKFEARSPEYGRWQKALNVADTFMQRHMNGDMYQDQSPDDWDVYNGPIMAMSMKELMHAALENRDPELSRWYLCPSAQRSSLIFEPNRVIVKYDFVMVGRSVPPHPNSQKINFSDFRNGQILSIDVIVNGQAKVEGIRQRPLGLHSGPYLQYVRFLKQQLKTKPLTSFGETKQQMAAENAEHLAQIAAIERAAKVCAVRTNPER